MLPVPGVKAPSVVFRERLPFTFRVLAKFAPLLRSITAVLRLLAPPFPTVTLPPTSKTPEALVKTILPNLLEFPPPVIATFPVTVSVKAPMLSWLVPLPLGALTVKLAHVVVTSRVTAKALLFSVGPTTTLSEEPGTACLPYEPDLAAGAPEVSVSEVLFAMLETVPMRLPPVS